MKFAIVGAGGVGGYLAARLASGGADVSVVARGRHLEAIRAGGLTLRMGGADTVARVVAADDPAAIGPVDAVLVAVKGQDLAALDLSPLVGGETVVWPFLNGVEATARLDAALGAGRTLVGVARISAFIEAPGLVAVHSPWARFELGEADGRRSDRVRRLAAAVAAAGVDVTVPDDPMRALWLKFLMLGPFSGVTAAARCDAETARGTPRMAAFFRRLAEETCAVGRAAGVALTEADVDAVAIKALASLPPTMKASMAHDLTVGKPLEVDWLAGAVSRMGDAHGVDTPANDAVWAMLTPFSGGAA